MSKQVLSSHDLFDKKVWVPVNGVKRVTEKAVLIEANGDVWIPRSIVTLLKTNRYEYTIVIPSWFFFKNKLAFTDHRGLWFKSDGETIRNWIATGEMTAEIYTLTQSDKEHLLEILEAIGFPQERKALTTENVWWLESNLRHHSKLSNFTEVAKMLHYALAATVNGI